MYKLRKLSIYILLITSIICLILTFCSYFIKDSKRWDDIINLICCLIIISLLIISSILQICYLIKNKQALLKNKKLILFALITILSLIFIIYSGIRKNYVDSFLGTLVILLSNLHIYYQIDLIESQ